MKFYNNHPLIGLFIVAIICETVVTTIKILKENKSGVEPIIDSNCDNVC